MELPLQIFFRCSRSQAVTHCKTKWVTTLQGSRKVVKYRWSFPMTLTILQCQDTTQWSKMELQYLHPKVIIIYYSMLKIYDYLFYKYFYILQIRFNKYICCNTNRRRVRHFSESSLRLLSSSTEQKAHFNCNREHNLLIIFLSSNLLHLWNRSEKSSFSTCFR